MKDKSRVTAPAFSLGARQRVFFVRLGMQENGEVAADRLVALRPHDFRRCADDDVVAVFDRQAEQFIADGAADQIDLHDSSRRSRLSGEYGLSQCRRAVRRRGSGGLAGWVNEHGRLSLRA